MGGRNPNGNSENLTPGGKPGRKWKTTKIRQAAETCQELGFDPCEFLASVANGDFDGYDHGMRLAAAKELIRYTHAPRRAEDGSGNAETLQVILPAEISGKDKQ